MRDQGLLESALAKPQHRFFYESAALPELAASYAAGVVLNHPFVDGNKRTAFVMAAAFLEINGWRFTADEADAVIQTLALAAGELAEAGYAAWLTANSNPA
jgi:death-on-curing protein